MALMPARVKWRKQQRGTMKGNATRGNKVSLGEYGLQAMEPGRISGRVIEAGRMACSHYLAAKGGCTSASSRTRASRKSRWKRVWARARASRSSGRGGEARDDPV